MSCTTPIRWCLKSTTSCETGGILQLAYLNTDWHQRAGIVSVTVYEIVKQSDKNLTNAQLPSLCNDQERLLLSLFPLFLSRLLVHRICRTNRSDARCLFRSQRLPAVLLPHRSRILPCLPAYHCQRSPRSHTTLYSPASIFATVTVLALLQVVATSVSLPAKTPRLFTPASALESALVGVSIFF